MAESAPSPPAPQNVAQPAPSSAPQPDPSKSAEPPVMAQPAPPPQNKPQKGAVAVDQRLKSSIADAYALLDFAARRGMKVNPNITEVIITVNDKSLRFEPISDQEQTQFWTAFTQIIEQVHPVSVDSIFFSTSGTDQSNESLFVRWFMPHSSRADRVLKRYLFIAIASLLVLLVLQVQWAIGTSIYNDAFEVHDNLKTSTNSLEQARRLGETIDDKTSAAAVDAKLQLEKTERQYKLDKSWDDVSYVRLWWWNRNVSALVSSVGLGEPGDGPPSEAGGFNLDDSGKRRIEFTRAALTLETISNYLLVTLFALLGAMTQALRRLAKQLSDVSLTEQSLYSIRTRIILGVISGVCMAWLMISSNAQPANGEATTAIPLNAISFLGAFAPWALAFISGYSVEIFFSALERIISSITKQIKGPQAEKPSPETNAQSPKT